MSLPHKDDAKEQTSFRDKFNQFARFTADMTGSPWAFITALGVVILWGVTGPLFGYSDTWQLVINTSTTIITFIMVFLIQSTQNRDSQAIHLKLDELLRAAGRARNELVDLEDLSEKEIEALAKQFALLHERAESKKKTRKKSKEDV